MFILLSIVFQSYSQVSQAQILKGTKEVEQIDWFGLYDFSKAEKFLFSIEKKKSFTEIPELRLKLSLAKVRLYASTGDFVRVKFELNQIRKIKMLTSVDKSDLKVFEVYSILYGDANSKLNVEELLARIIQQKEEYPPFARLLASTKLASIVAEQGDVSKLKLSEKATNEIVKELNRREVDFFVKTAYGQFYFFVNDIKKSKHYFIDAKRLAKDNKWLCSEQYANLNLGETFLYSNEIELAKKHFDTVVKNKLVTEQRDLYQVYGCLEYYFKLKNNPDSSYYYLELRNEVDDIMEDAKSRNLVGQMDNLYKEEVNLYNYQMELKKNQRLKAVLSIFILGIILVSIFTFFVFSHIKRTNRVLRKQKSQIESNLLLKEKLIKEIHHRVKNNLQIVSSILNLQSKNINDEKALQIIEEGKERIQAIALIHNQLHLSKETAFVEMDTYLLQFIEQIKHSFIASAKNVDFDLDIENMKMTIDNAVPLGMIFCELLSNSFKHGFKNKSDGLIQITMHRILVGKSHLIEISYSDNGIGYTGSVPFFEQDSTGVEIIQAFVEQLDAEFNLDTNFKGFKIRLRFEPLKLGN